MAEVCKSDQRRYRRSLIGEAAEVSGIADHEALVETVLGGVHGREAPDPEVGNEKKMTTLSSTRQLVDVGRRRSLSASPSSGLRPPSPSGEGKERQDTP
jgi:hypothetical protein